MLSEIFECYVEENTDVDFEILNKVEIDRYGEHCMTLVYICTIAR